MQSTTKTKHAIDPVSNSRTLDRKILIAERLMVGVAVAVTSAGFFVWGRSAAMQYTDNPMAPLAVGAGVALVAAFVTDFAFCNFLEEVIFQALAVWYPSSSPVAEHGYIKFLRFVRWLVLTAIVAALFYADYNSVYTIRDPLADQARKEATVDVIAKREEVTSRQAQDLAPMRERIAQLRSDIKTASDNASTPELRRLAAKGNQWAIPQVMAAQAKATRKMRVELEQLESAYNKALTAGVATLTTTTVKAEEVNDEINRANNAKKASLAGMFTMFGVGSKTMTVLLRIFLVLSFLTQNPNLDANRDGRIDGRDVTASAGGPLF